ncbi:MAG: endonuclease III [Caulobacteraceae bacterium]|nr:endonuclease III [Caulobacteraceae bacterium]
MANPGFTLVWPPDADRVEQIFERLAGVMPEPKTELDFKDAYTLVVAVALSAQATDVSVNKATKTLFKVADTPAKMLVLGEAGLIPYIQSIGLYRTKAKNVMAAARILQDQYGGVVPLERTALQSLPGVGRKTASVVLNELGIEAAIAVDTHVFRVSHRLGLANAASPDRVEQQLMVVTPEAFLAKAHHWLILHGRYTCKAQRPLCERCVVADLCPSRRYYAEGPSPKTARPRPPAKSRTARAKPAPRSGSKPR